MYCVYLLTSDLLSSIISNTDKHEFSCIWKWISYCNDVMNHVDCVIKRDVYPQKMHSCSKDIRGISKYIDINLKTRDRGFDFWAGHPNNY